MYLEFTGFTVRVLARRDRCNRGLSQNTPRLEQERPRTP